MEQEGSSDVTEFLARIKELGEKTNREDELRAKRLEEEILEGRKRRQALRAERARSLSPQKKYENLEKNKDTREILGVLNDLVGESTGSSNHKPLKPSSDIKPGKRQISNTRKVSGPIPGPKPKFTDTTLKESSSDSLNKNYGLKEDKKVEDNSGVISPASSTAFSPKLTNNYFKTSSRQNSPSLMTPNAEKKALPKPLSSVSPQRDVLSPKPRSPWSPGRSPDNTGSSEHIQRSIANDSNDSASGSASPRLSRSPTRGGSSFIQSALLRRENSTKPSSFSASPKLNGLFDSPIVLANPVAKTPSSGSHTSTPQISKSLSQSKSVDSQTTESNFSHPSKELTGSIENIAKFSKSPAPSPTPKSFNSPASLGSTERKESDKLHYFSKTLTSPRSMYKLKESSSPISSSLNTDGNMTTSKETKNKEEPQTQSAINLEQISTLDYSAGSTSSLENYSSPNTHRVPTEKPPIHKKSTEILATTKSLQSSSSPDNSSDSRRWNSSRQTTWLESALKKNGPATPETGLVRAGTLRGTSRSPSPTKHSVLNSPSLNDSPSLSRNRFTLSPELSRSPSDIVRERPMSYLQSTKGLSNNDSSIQAPHLKENLVFKEISSKNNNLDKLKNDSSQLKKDGLTEERAPSKSQQIEVERLTTVKGKPKSLDYLLNESVEFGKITKASEETSSLEGKPPSSVTSFESPTLKPVPPKPLAPKPTAEAIERLNSLRKTTTQKFILKDEEKEVIEHTKAALRRSQTLQYKAPDTVKESIISAKSSLRQSSPVRQPRYLEPKIQEQREEDESFISDTKMDSKASMKENRKPESFTASLASVILKGPAPERIEASIKRAATLDNSDMKSGSTKLSHINRTRTRGPKRRLPKSIKSEPSSPMHHSPSVNFSDYPPRSEAINISKRGAVDLKRSPPKPRKPSSSVRIPSRTTVAS